MAAAELLGVSERTFRRWCGRYEEDGVAGLEDRRLGQEAPNRVPEAEADGVEVLYREQVCRLHGQAFPRASGEPGLPLGLHLDQVAAAAGGLLVRAKRRGAHRRKRPRRPLPGMLLHQDASRHAWLAGVAGVRPGGDAGRCDQRDLLGDPGGGGGHGVELGWAFGDVRRAGSAVQPVYRPRQPLLHTPKAGGRVEPGGDDAGGAGAAPARGRAHRRLLAGGTGALGAGVPHVCRTGCRRSWRWLASPRSPRPTPGCARCYLAAHNARFAVVAEQPGSAFVPVPGVPVPGVAVAGPALREVLCHEEERQVGNDNTVLHAPDKLECYLHGPFDQVPSLGL